MTTPTDTCPECAAFHAGNPAHMHPWTPNCIPDDLANDEPTATRPAAPVDPVMAGSPVEMPRRVDLADVRPGDRVEVLFPYGPDGKHPASICYVGDVEDVSEDSLSLHGLCRLSASGGMLRLLHRPRRLPVVGEPVADDMAVPRNTRAEWTDPHGDTWHAVMWADGWWHFTGTKAEHKELPSVYRVAFVPEPTT